MISKITVDIKDVEASELHILAGSIRSKMIESLYAHISDETEITFKVKYNPTKIVTAVNFELKE